MHHTERLSIALTVCREPVKPSRRAQIRKLIWAIYLKRIEETATSAERENDPTAGAEALADMIMHQDIQKDTGMLTAEDMRGSLVRLWTEGVPLG